MCGLIRVNWIFFYEMKRACDAKSKRPEPIRSSIVEAVKNKPAAYFFLDKAATLLYKGVNI